MKWSSIVADRKPANICNLGCLGKDAEIRSTSPSFRSANRHHRYDRADWPLCVGAPQVPKSSATRRKPALLVPEIPSGACGHWQMPLVGPLVGSMGTRIWRSALRSLGSAHRCLRVPRCRPMHRAAVSIAAVRTWKKFAGHRLRALARVLERSIHCWHVDPRRIRDHLFMGRGVVMRL